MDAAAQQYFVEVGGLLEDISDPEEREALCASALEEAVSGTNALHLSLDPQGSRLLETLLFSRAATADSSLSTLTSLCSSWSSDHRSGGGSGGKSSGSWGGGGSGSSRGTKRGRGSSMAAGTGGGGGGSSSSVGGGGAGEWGGGSSPDAPPGAADMCSHPAASRVIEACLHVLRQKYGADDGDDGEGEGGGRGKAGPGSRVGRRVQGVMHKMYGALKRDLLPIMTSPCGSHVLRLLLHTLSGLSPPADSPSSSSPPDPNARAKGTAAAHCLPPHLAALIPKLPSGTSTKKGKGKGKGKDVHDELFLSNGLHPSPTPASDATSDSSSCRMDAAECRLLGLDRLAVRLANDIVAAAASKAGGGSVSDCAAGAAASMLMCCHACGGPLLQATLAVLAALDDGAVTVHRQQEEPLQATQHADVALARLLVPRVTSKQWPAAAAVPVAADSAPTAASHGKSQGRGMSKHRGAAGSEGDEGGGGGGGGCAVGGGDVGAPGGVGDGGKGVAAALAAKQLWEGLNAERMVEVAVDKTGSRFVEAALRAVSSKTVGVLFSSVFKDRLAELAAHPFANFVVQALVLRLPNSKLLKKAYKELNPVLARLLTEGRAGVVAALISSCGRLHTFQSKICSSLLSVASSMGATSASSSSAVTAASMSQPATWRMVWLASTSTAADGAYARSKSSLLGCIMLQSLLTFPEGCIAPLLDDLLNWPPHHWRDAAVDPRASRVVDFLLASPTVPQVTKADAIRGMCGHYAEIVRSPIGVHVAKHAWETAADDPDLQEVIVGDLSRSAASLTRLPHATDLLHHMRAREYARDREAWRRKWSQRMELLHDFAELFESAGDQTSQKGSGGDPHASGDGGLEQRGKSIRPKNVDVDDLQRQAGNTGGNTKVERKRSASKDKEQKPTALRKEMKESTDQEVVPLMTKAMEDALKALGFPGDG